MQCPMLSLKCPMLFYLAGRTTRMELVSGSGHAATSPGNSNNSCRHFRVIAEKEAADDVSAV